VASSPIFLSPEFASQYNSLDSVYIQQSVFGRTRAPAVDIGSLQQQLKIMQDELSKNVIKLNASENANKVLESKLARYDDQMRQQVNRNYC